MAGRSSFLDEGVVIGDVRRRAVSPEAAEEQEPELVAGVAKLAGD